MLEFQCLRFMDRSLGYQNSKLVNGHVFLRALKILVHGTVSKETRYTCRLDIVLNNTVCYRIILYVLCFLKLSAENRL